MMEKPAKRMLAGNGVLLGLPQKAQFDKVVAFFWKILPQFPELVLKKNISNENGLNSFLSRFIINNSANEFFFAQRESMEDETRGNSPAADIGIYLKVEDMPIDSPRITVFEGKRLTCGLPVKRRREYVIGHENKGKQVHCGGMERFKLSIHGGNLVDAGIIGYIQDGSPDTWLQKINLWIADLCKQSLPPKWTENEKLTLKKTIGQITECSSTVTRADEELYLTHLWIDLTNSHQ